MTQIKNSIEPTDVEWTMNWSDRPSEQVFEADAALAHLLINGVIFTNDHWWEKEAPEHLQKATGLYVNCNDVFAWASADADELPHAQIERLYRLWVANPQWGPVKWSCLHRQEKPQAPMQDAMKKAGYWDAELESLPENAYWAKLKSKSDSAASAAGE